jgi:hypothetical protein
MKALITLTSILSVAFMALAITLASTKINASEPKSLCEKRAAYLGAPDYSCETAIWKNGLHKGGAA